MVNISSHDITCNCGNIFIKLPTEDSMHLEDVTSSNFLGEPI